VDECKPLVTDYEAPAAGGRRVIRIMLRKKGIGMMVGRCRLTLSNPH